MKTAIYVALGLFLILFLYAGVYFANMDPGRLSVCYTTESGLPAKWRSHEYRLCPERSEIVFWPALEIDQQIRPAFWGLD